LEGWEPTTAFVAFLVGIAEGVEALGVDLEDEEADEARKDYPPNEF
jgi:hypothetical protein